MHRKPVHQHLSHYKVRYPELISRYESLLRLLSQLPTHENRIVIEALLLGANELLIRQDETGTDFNIAIITLLDTVARDVSPDKPEYKGP